MPTLPPEELSLVPIEGEPRGGTRSAREARVAAPCLALVPVPRPSSRGSSRPSSSSHVERGHRGPGWFDSSWELSAGCEVREGWPADAGLREWIEAWLVQPATAATLSRGGA